MALRTKIALPGIIEDEVSGRENTFFMRGSCSGMDAVFESLLSGETFIPLAKLQVGDIGIEILILAEDEIGQREIITIRAELLAVEVVRTFADGPHVLLGSRHYGRQILVILAAKGLRMQDDLAFGIDQRLCVVSLDDAMRSGHLGRLIVGQVALDLFAAFPDLGLLLLKKHIQAFHLMLQTLPLYLASFCFGVG